jgi:hypothetical protein
MFGMLFLGLKNIIQYVRLKDHSFSNSFQIGFTFVAALGYSFFKGAGINIQPWLIGVTVFLSIILLLEAITLGEKRKEFEDKRVVKDDKGRKRIQPIPKELGIVLTTFVFNLGAFILALLQITNLLEKLFLEL